MHPDNALSIPDTLGASRQATARPAPAGLALFDLDHTLIPFDSGGAFTRWLTERGVLDQAFEARYLAYCHDYAAGKLDMRAMHRHTVGTLGAYAPHQLLAWLQEFEALMVARVPTAALALVQSHRTRGDLCVLVTATTRFIAESFARLFRIEHVLATEPERDVHGRLTGEIVGEPCFRRHKCCHLERWLGAQGLALADFERSSFYSDSQHDLPLLQAVRRPVAVNADPALSAHAQAHGWEMLSLR